MLLRLVIYAESTKDACKEDSQQNELTGERQSHGERMIHIFIINNNNCNVNKHKIYTGSLTSLLQMYT